MADETKDIKPVDTPSATQAAGKHEDLTEQELDGASGGGGAKNISWGGGVGD
jgi:hypothetical protein